MICHVILQSWNHGLVEAVQLFFGLQAVRFSGYGLDDDSFQSTARHLCVSWRRLSVVNADSKSKLATYGFIRCQQALWSSSSLSWWSPLDRSSAWIILLGICLMSLFLISCTYANGDMKKESSPKDVDVIFSAPCLSGIFVSTTSRCILIWKFFSPYRAGWPSVTRYYMLITHHSFLFISNNAVDDGLLVAAS